MAEAVGDIAIRLGADIAPFQRGIGQAERSLGRFERNSQRMGRTLVNVGRASAAAVAGIAAAGVTLAAQAARAGVEIENLSRISQTSTTQFQRLAAASETVGISQEKLADIFRDVTDRVGDFIATGAGPMADFFENIAPQVGVTIDQFARLSGPEALQLYVTSLERANVTQAEMAFYLEALASDASDLYPLLRDNGQAFQELGDAAERAGRVMSQEAISNARELDNVLRTVAGTIRTNLNNALLENGDQIFLAADSINNFMIPALNDLVPVVTNVVSQLSQLAGTITSIAGAINSMIEAIPGDLSIGDLMPGQQWLNGAGTVRDAWGDFWDYRSDLVNPGNIAPTRNPHEDAPGMSMGGGGLDGDIMPPLTLGVPVPGGGGGGGGSRGGGGGGGGSNPFAGYETLQQRLMTEREVIEEEYQARLEMLREYREAGGAIDEEYNETARRVTEEHAARIREIEERSRQERLAMAGDLMGSLATILEAGGERNLGIVRGLRIAEAVIEGYGAAVAAWNRGMSVPVVGGPALAAQYTALSLLRTGGLIAQMKSAGKGSTGGGGGGGGSVPSGSGDASGQGGRQSTNVAIQLNGQMFGRSQVIELINAINEAQEDGAVVRLV